MPKKIAFLAVVPSTKNNKTLFEAYFFCKSTHQIFSLKVNEEIVDFVINKGKYQNGKYINREFTKNLESLNINEIVVKKERPQKYKIVIKTKLKFISRKITTSFYSGFIVSQLLNIPMRIENKTLREDGIYITKKLLKDSLAQV